jgi:hypothetical protein
VIDQTALRFWGGILFNSFSYATDAVSYSHPKSRNTAATSSVFEFFERFQLGAKLGTSVFETRFFGRNDQRICVAFFEVAGNRVYRLTLPHFSLGEPLPTLARI